ncbi:hypothetical protein B566_EDAN010617 [Ephemera danica]|nr:hypothetical protein B566_EDAN010617 [Ephemera danica]
MSENSLAPRSSAMPASVNETVSASLLLSLSTKCGPENGEIPLEQRMAAATKRVLHTGIEYEISNDTYHSSVLQGLKAKYAHEDTSLTNGSCSNSPNAQGKGVVDSNNPNLPVPTRVLFPMEKVQMQWALQRNHPGSGFINAGNSCYLNSVLQVNLYERFLHLAALPFNNTTECIICCMAVTLKQSQQRPEQMRPHLILARLRSICKRLIPGQQEDAMEFLRYLFEAMEKCYLYRFSGMKLDNSSKETTPLNQIFGGYIRTDVTCLHCRGVSTTFQHFLDLTLDISRGPSLEHALDIYFSQERLEGDNSYRCDKCRRKVPAAKQFFIERLPNVLCIQLKRFNIEGKKISKGIQLAERINLQRFLSRPKPLPGQHVQKPPRGACYRLQAGVNHLGHTAQSGHYTTVAYASNSNLYHFDDSCVQRVWSGRGFSGTDVYLLMYVLDSKQENSRPVSTPSATATSQSLQNVASRSPAKPSVSPSFIPLQCRPKPAIILNQNPNKIIFNNSLNPMRVKEPLVAPTRSPAELAQAKSPVATTTSNKFSKLVTSSVPVSKNGMIPVSSPVKSNVQSPSPSPTFNRIPPKAQNGVVQVALSMPSLVPYSEEHSSGDEAESPLSNQPTTSKENLTAPITNGWTVTPSKNNQVKDAEPSKSDKYKLESNSGDPLKKLLPKLPESPKSIPKVNGLDHKDRKLNSPKVGQDSAKKLNKPVINGETTTLKKSCDIESSSVAEPACLFVSYFCVRSTSSSWHVSPVVKSPEKEKETMQRSAQPMVPASEPHAATASWVVTSAPTSAEHSPGALSSPPSSAACKEKETSNGRKRTYSKRRSRSSSSSSSSSTSSTESNGKTTKHPKIWVERTKDTIFESKEKKKKKSEGLKRPASSKEPDTGSNVVDELRKQSHAGYVSTWNGGRSVVERQVREDFYERRRQHQDESEYDPEMDGGRRKKVKTEHHYQKDEERSGVNHFQQEADYRRNGDNRYQRQDDWDSRKNNNYYTKQYSSSNSNYKNWYSNQQHHHHYNNNHHNRYHNNYKGGNNWSRYPHGKRRNDRDYDSRSHYRHHNSHRYNNR